jgi:hypothetical protein
LGVAPTGRWAPLSKERADLPAGIDAGIDKGLSSRPRSRYQSAQEYLRALHEIRNAPLHSSSEAYFPNRDAMGIRQDTGQVQTPFAGRSAAGVSAPSQYTAAQRLFCTGYEPAVVPQTVSAIGRVQMKSLVWSNAPPEGLYQLVWQVFEAFGLRKMQNNQQTRTIRGVTGLNWQTFGQKISANVEAVSGGSTVNIIDQTMGPALIDMGRGREEVRAITGMLIHKLAGAGWNANIVREVHRSLPTWLVVLICLGMVLLLVIINLIIYDYA